MSETTTEPSFAVTIKHSLGRGRFRLVIREQVGKADLFFPPQDGKDSDSACKACKLGLLFGQSIHIFASGWGHIPNFFFKLLASCYYVTDGTLELLPTRFDVVGKVTRVKCS